ncbi:hypothetical protein GCM10027347_18290 [Larkinella harenae]
MAINVINFSIDAPDQLTQPLVKNVGAEDLSVNKMESIGEVLLEKVLKIPDAVPEQDDPDHPFAVKIVKSICDWATPASAAALQKITISFPLVPEKKQFFYAAYYTSHFPEIDSPPPRRG